MAQHAARPRRATTKREEREAGPIRRRESPGSRASRQSAGGKTGAAASSRAASCGGGARGVSFSAARAPEERARAHGEPRDRNSWSATRVFCGGQPGCAVTPPQSGTSVGCRLVAAGGSARWVCAVRLPSAARVGCPGGVRWVAASREAPANARSSLIRAAPGQRPPQSTVVWQVSTALASTRLCRGEKAARARVAAPIGARGVRRQTRRPVRLRSRSAPWTR